VLRPRQGISLIVSAAALTLVIGPTNTGNEENNRVFQAMIEAARTMPGTRRLKRSNSDGTASENEMRLTSFRRAQMPIQAHCRLAFHCCG